MTERKQNVQIFLLRWAAAEKETEIKLGEAFYACFPFAKLHADNEAAPWLTPKIKSMVDKMMKLHFLWSLKKSRVK